MDRRTFLAGTGAVLLVVPRTVEAQQVGKLDRLGYLPGQVNLDTNLLGLTIPPRCCGGRTRSFSNGSAVFLVAVAGGLTAMPLAARAQPVSSRRSS